MNGDGKIGRELEEHQFRLDLRIVILFIPSTTMRLLAHNLLICNMPECQQHSFPLSIDIEESVVRETEFNMANIKKLIHKLDWPALYRTMLKIGEKGFPEHPSDELKSEEFLKKLHRIILDTHVLKGTLKCPNCSKEYAVVNGIPNMISHEAESS